MAEVSDITIKRTQDSLGKLIKKPVFTDKLLRKPPFKFLHDIIHAVITNTGLFDGLYTNEELQSENIKERDAKIAFLQKAIDTLKIATKQDVRARPSKIVAGLEAEKTNEFLIAIAKAIDRKIDTTEAVVLVKSGNVNNTQKKESQAAAAGGAKVLTKVESRSKGSKDTNESKKAKSSDAKSSKKTDSGKKAAAAKQSSKDSSEVKKSKSKLSSQNREQRNEDKKKESDKKSAPRNEDAEMELKPTEQQPQTNQFDVIQNTNGNAVMSNELIDDWETKPNIQNDQMIAAIANNDELPKENATTTTKQDEKQEVNHQREVDQKPERIEKTAKSAKSARSIDKNDVRESLPNKKTEKVQMPRSSEMIESKNKSHEAAEEQAANDLQDIVTNDKPRSSKSRRSNRDAGETPTVNGMQSTTKPEPKSSMSVDKLIERPSNPSSSLLESSTKSLEATNGPSSKARPALRSAAVRPISARPSAPRRRDRNVRQILHTESFLQEPNSQQNTNNKSNNKKNAIPEFDDADNIVITETIQDNISILNESATNNNEMTTDIDGSKQGHLVQQILETQTAILKADASKNDPSAINDESILSDRKSFTRNTTELRKMIQKLSLYITPLGKMMEYFQEDVDAMQIELLMWQKAGAAAQADIKEEQRATEKLLENFKYHLAEINNSIKDHVEQINNTTTNIIQNEDKISKLIATL